MIEPFVIGCCRLYSSRLFSRMRRDANKVMLFEKYNREKTAPDTAGSLFSVVHIKIEDKIYVISSSIV